jgi:DNA-3-methyladenine glycosylase
MNQCCKITANKRLSTLLVFVHISATQWQIVLMNDPLPLEFYKRDTIEVALDLLGKELVHQSKRDVVSGIITEVEAYLGVEDPACHSYRNRRTPRTEAMYRPGGYSYVYLVYGMHHCFNVVTSNANNPEAVLIRAMHPLLGLKSMQKRRPNVKTFTDFSNGPGKLCQAMGIDLTFNGLPLEGERLFIRPSKNKNFVSEILSGPRVGIDYAGDASEWPLRFWIPTQANSKSGRDGASSHRYESLGFHK